MKTREMKVNTFGMFCEFFNTETMVPQKKGRYVLWVRRENETKLEEFHVTGFWDGDSWKDESGCEWGFDPKKEQAWWSPQLMNNTERQEVE